MERVILGAVASPAPASRIGTLVCRMPAYDLNGKVRAGHRRRPRDRLRDGAPAAHARRLGRGPRPRRRRGARGGRADRRAGDRDRRRRHRRTARCMAAVAETVERFGGLDVAIANAGIAQPHDRRRRGRSPARNGSGSSRSTCSASGARCGRRCRRSSSASGQHRHHLLGLRLRQRHARTAPTRSLEGGVESLGRALRAELTPLGASASVAYFGWVDTKTGPGHLRPKPRRRAAAGDPARLPAQADHPGAAGAAIVARHRGAGAADLRAEVAGATSPPCAA